MHRHQHRDGSRLPQGPADEGGRPGGPLRGRADDHPGPLQRLPPVQLLPADGGHHPGRAGRGRD